MTPKRILVATDFSPAAELAVRRAISLAARFGAELRLVHAAPPLGLIEGLFPSQQHWNDTIAVRAAVALKKQAARIAGERIRVSTGLLVGRASVAVAAAVKDYEPDLLVIGARGERLSQAKSGLGGTASKLVRSSRLPLLLVRRSERNVPRRVLAAVDLARGSDNVARWARALAAANELTVVHVFEAPFTERLHTYGVSSKAIDVYAADQYAERQQAMEAFLGRLDMGEHINALVLRGNAVRTISRRLRSLNIDTLVIGQHGRRKRDAAAPHGSVCHYLSHFTSVDVLVVP